MNHVVGFLDDLQDRHADGVGSDRRTDAEHSHLLFEVSWALDAISRTKLGTAVEMEYDNDSLSFGDVFEAVKVFFINQQPALDLR